MPWNQTYFYETKHHKTWVSVYPYITQAPKINRHAESICFTLARLNKYIFSWNASKIMAIPRCQKFQTLCSQIHQWESVEEENLGVEPMFKPGAGKRGSQKLYIQEPKQKQKKEGRGKTHWDKYPQIIWQYQCFVSLRKRTFFPSTQDIVRCVGGVSWFCFSVVFIDFLNPKRLCLLPLMGSLENILEMKVENEIHP